MNKGLKLLSDCVFTTKYAQTKPDGKKETWDESVDRIYDMHRNYLISKGYKLEMFEDELNTARQLEKEKYFLSSQRARQFASPRFDEGILANHSKLYNCTYTVLNRPRAFAEIMYELLCGSGVGVGIYKEYIKDLPEVKPMRSTKTVYSIPDSIEGWAHAIEVLFDSAFSGHDITFDYGQIRPKGALVAGKFKAPGPDPLRECIEACRAILKRAGGRQLTTFECHRLVCLIGRSVVSGGVRRSAIIVQCDHDDMAIIRCKGYGNLDLYNIKSVKFNNGTLKVTYHNGDVEMSTPYIDSNELDKVNEVYDGGMIYPCHIYPELYMSNNSVSVPYGEPLSLEDINRILYINRFIGDIGFVRVPSKEYGFNPCGEVLIHAFKDGKAGFGFCNLVEINLDKIDTHEMFYKVCKYASLVATIQALYTDFKFIGQTSIDIANRDRAIGVGLTGIVTSSIRGKILERGARIVVETNEDWANKFGIEPSKRSTVVKPSGNASVLLGCTGAGIHPPHDYEYLRRIRTSDNSPEWELLKDTPLAKYEYGEYIISFPCQSTGPVKKDFGGIELMKLIGEIKHFWINKGVLRSGDYPNNVSATVELGDDEWDSIAALLYCNSHIYSGVSFLKRFDTFYPNLPYTRKSEAPEEYDAICKYLETNDISFSNIGVQVDDINKYAAMSCSGGSCEIV